MDAKLISIDAAAKTLSIGRSKVYQLIGDGTLATVNIGRRRLVKVASLANVIGDDG